MPISFYLFIQACRGYSIQLRQIRIQYDPVPPNYVNSLRNILRHDPLFYFILYFLERTAHERGYFGMNARPEGTVGP